MGMSLHKRSYPRTLSVVLFFLVILATSLLLDCRQSGASDESSDAKGYLKKGKGDLAAGRYEDAIKSLSAAEKGFPLLRDYALFYLSEAYHNLGEHRKASEMAKALIEQYPQSPLLKKARLSEIREAKEIPDKDLIHLYEAYLKDYPGEEEVSMWYGALLKQKGEGVKASSLFRNIYVRAGSLSGQALDQLASADVTPSDLIERASNLMKRYEFRSAEQDLRKALSLDNGKNRDEILRSLGYSLFRQKAYREASLIYDRVHDFYFKARSLYRAGDKQGFESALDDLLTGNDKRAGELLVAKAADKRREKDFEEALTIYRGVLTRFPSEAEDAMWGIGWTHYSAGEYKKASEIFSEMYSKYEDPKYLYWKARSAEAAGEDARELYHSLIKAGNNFYSALALSRNKEKPGKLVSYSGPYAEVTPGNEHQSQRIEALLSLGMTREATTELAFMSGKLDTPSGLFYVVSKLQELGEFKRSITLATKAPYSEKLHKFWYPLAFWDDVEKISKKQEVDPLVVLSVMREESRFDANAKSVAGARGLMQIMPHTAYRLDKSLKLGIRKESEIHDPKNNISLGAYYLKSLFHEFKSLPHVLAAYNAGEAAVRKWEQSGNYKSADEFIEDIPFAETRNYVKKVVTSYYQYRRAVAGDKAEVDFSLTMGKL